jgi:hypothetical protein
MQTPINNSYSHTADYFYIESALKRQWPVFETLENEFKSFSPKTASDFAEYRTQFLARLVKLNPTTPTSELEAIVDGQIHANLDMRMQIHNTFADRIMSMYVTVAFLAHALAEATINAILAIGLVAQNSQDLFTLLERTDIKEKWVTGPRVFAPSFSFPKGGTLYRTLQHLSRQRNAFIHYKIELEIDGKKALEGSRLDRAPLGHQLDWTRRFFNLPYDLSDHASKQLESLPFSFLLERRPIQPAQH